MKDDNKTKKQLINELAGLRRRIIKLEKTFVKFKKNAEDVDKELESISMELSISLSEVFEALKKISSGDPEVRISEESEFEIISKLKSMVNMTATNIAEMVDQSHEFAMGLAEHFDVLHRVSKGDFSARVSGESKVELLESLKKVTNIMVESLDREITRRTQMEHELKESEERYRRLFETSKDGILLLDKQTGNIININPAVTELFGDAREFIGKNLNDIGLFKDIEDAQEIIRKLDEVGFIYYDYVPVETKRGQRIDTEIYLINRTKVIQCNVRNITERIRAEEALKESERKLRLMTENMKDTIFAYNMNRKLIYVNPSFEGLTGYTTEELYRQNFIDYIHPDDKARMTQLREETFQGKFFSGVEFQIVTKDGQIKWCSSTWSPMFDEDGRQIGIQGRKADITERKRAEEALRKSEDELRKRVQELEEFYNMAVGREIRIKDLKEENEELKEEIERLKEQLAKKSGL